VVKNCPAQFEFSLPSDMTRGLSVRRR